MDESLPKLLLDGIQIVLTITGSIVITATVNPYLLVPLFVLCIFFIFMRKIYLKTSTNIKRLEGIGKSFQNTIHRSFCRNLKFFFSHQYALVKSPAFTHLAATLSGLSTVRAFNAEALLQNEFDYHQDTHSACWFMFIAASSAFGFALDLMCCIFIACIMVFYLLFDTGVSSGIVGLALTQALSMTGTLQWGTALNHSREKNILYNIMNISFQVFDKPLKS